MLLRGQVVHVPRLEIPQVCNLWLLSGRILVGQVLAHSNTWRLALQKDHRVVCGFNILHDHWLAYGCQHRSLARGHLQLLQAQAIADGHRLRNHHRSDHGFRGGSLFLLLSVLQLR